MKERALARGLSDDRADVIERRLQNFQELTLPLLEYYDYCQRLLTIDGEKSPDEVKRSIILSLEKTA